MFVRSCVRGISALESVGVCPLVLDDFSYVCVCSEDYTVKPSAETGGLTASNRCRHVDISRTSSTIGEDSHK